MPKPDATVQKGGRSAGRERSSTQQRHINTAGLGPVTGRTSFKEWVNWRTLGEQHAPWHGRTHDAQTVKRQFNEQ